jgi:hypothetical protein
MIAHNSFKVAALFLLIIFIKPVFGQLQEQQVTIDASVVVSHMQGGIGASWHSMSREIPLENEKYDYPVRFVNPRGSGYGGNPPVTDTAAWNQICNHARWLGLDFLRVELSQRMYEPDRGVFDWNNEEMQALFRILDWCEANHADVFLQQLWGDVAWNSYPGVHPLMSAPRSLDEFANGIATLLQYLTVTRKYSCIKYFCLTNEPPGGTWGYWWSYGSGSGTVTSAWKKVRETLDEKEIRIPLSGPDWTDLPPFDSSKIDFDPYIGSYDIHSYGGIDYDGEEIIHDWVTWAHQHKKPFFLTEFGNMKLGWGGDNPGPKSFAASLSNASDVVRSMNMGADGFNRWSFVNRGDLDGQWQLIHTWDREHKQYLKKVEPEPAAYFGFAMLSRFMGKHPDLILWQTNMCIDGVKLTAYKNKNGSIGVLLINNEKRPVRISLSFTGSENQSSFNLYQVTEMQVMTPGFQLEPVSIQHMENQPRIIILPPESISLVTTLELKSGDWGIIE